MEDKLWSKFLDDCESSEEESEKKLVEAVRREIDQSVSSDSEAMEELIYSEKGNRTFNHGVREQSSGKKSQSQAVRRQTIAEMPRRTEFENKNPLFDKESSEYDNCADDDDDEDENPFAKLHQQILKNPIPAPQYKKSKKSSNDPIKIKLENRNYETYQKPSCSSPIIPKYTKPRVSRKSKPKSKMVSSEQYDYAKNMISEHRKKLLTDYPKLENLIPEQQNNSNNVSKFHQKFKDFGIGEQPKSSYFDNSLTKKIVNQKLMSYLAQKEEIRKNHEFGAIHNQDFNEEIYQPTQNNFNYIETQKSMANPGPAKDLNAILPKIDIDNNSLTLISSMFNHMIHDIESGLQKQAFKKSRHHNIKTIILKDVLTEAVEKYCK